MSYALTLYHKTGFTALDIPANQAVLASSASSVTTAEPLQVVQDYPMSYIDISSKWADVEDVDYAKVGKYLYAVEPSQMIANDVCRLNLTFCAITNGAGNFTITGGITSRTTEHTDDWGEWDEDDPLTAPAMQMDLEYTAPILQDGAGLTLVESTVDLDVLQKEVTSGQYKSITFTDSSTASGETVTHEVTTPYTQDVDGETTFTLDGTRLPGPGGVKMFYSPSKEVKGVIRSLGIEGGIVGQVSLPSNGIAYQLPSTGETAIGSIASTTQSADSGLNPQYAAVKNKRILYGKYNTWGLITCAGNKAEYQVEQITKDGSSPVVKRKSDPRPDGAPYFRFSEYMGDTSDSGFFVNAVRGMQWRNVPIVYSGVSGSYLQKENFQNTEILAQGAERLSELQTGRDINRTEEDYKWMLGQKAAGGVLDIGMGVDVANIAKATADVLQYSLNSARKEQDLVTTLSYTKAKYNTERENARLNFAYGMNVVLPSVNFPINSSLMQDLYGNGVIVYRYKYQDADIKRIDKLLTMYGYKITRALSLEDLYPSGKSSGFTYTEAQGVSINSAALPKWFCDLIVAQIGAGVRIWWERPNPSKYEGSTKA